MRVRPNLTHSCHSPSGSVVRGESGPESDVDLLVDFFVDFETGTSLDEVALFRDLEGSSPYDRGMPSLYEVGSKVAMQNSHAETEDQLHPLREVPRCNWPGDEDGG